MAFDENYRYRDPNWVFGVELSEMVFQFPLSRETLQEALQEIGNLQLRNSYDRIFLYRCLASGKSPRPDSFVRADVLSIEQRRQVAERLEHFFRHHIHGRRHKRVERWAKEASERIGVPLQVVEGEASEVTERDYGSTLASLGAFLIAIKEMEPEEIRSRLEASDVASVFSEELRDEVIDHLVATPPMFFDYPDLDPENPIVALYFDDLVRFEAESRPLDLQGFWAIREAGEYFRQNIQGVEERLLECYNKLLSAELSPDSPEKTVPKGLLLALPRMLGEQEVAFFVYGKVGLPEDGKDKNFISGRGGKLSRWLVGTGRRLFVLEIREDLRIDDFKRYQVVWSLNMSESTPEALRLNRKGLLKDQLVIQGGSWEQESDPDRSIRLHSDKLKGFENYFGALFRWLETAGTQVGDSGVTCPPQLESSGDQTPRLT